MANRISIKLSALAVTAALGFAAAPSAEALLILSATVGPQSICATDNNLALCSHGTQIADSNPAVGQLAFATTTPILVGGLSLFSFLLTSTKGPPVNILNSSSLGVINTTANPVFATFAVSDTNFTPPATQATTTGSGIWGSAGGSSITLNWCNDPSNAQGAETPTDRPGTCFPSFTDIAGAILDAYATTGGPFAISDPNPFSMTLGFDFTLVGLGQLLAQGQSEIKPVVTTTVPEPSTLLLLGVGIAAAVGASRRRR